MHGKGCAWQEGAWWEAYVAGFVHDRGHAWQGACVAGEMATAEDGTHPTGIHSCSLYLFSTYCCDLLRIKKLSGCKEYSERTREKVSHC